LADVPVRGEAEIDQALPPAHREGRFQFFPREALPKLEDPTDRPGAHLALVLAAPRRLLRRALPLPSRRAATSGRWKNQELFMPDEPIIDLQSDHFFMGEALRQAAKAYAAEEVPVGAVVVREGRSSPALSTRWSCSKTPRRTRRCWR
jgi:hypothetical protein